MKLLAGTLLVASLAPAFGQISATWTSGTDGSWSDGARWSTNPVAPINGQPSAGDTYNATLALGRTVTLSGPVEIQNLTQSSGTITGIHPLTLRSGYSWTGGTMSGASETLVQGLLTLSGTGNKVLSSRALNLGDGLTPAQANWTQGAILLNSSSVFNNRPLSTFETSFDGAITITVGTGTFNNQGTFTKSGGTGATTIGSSVSFNNSGTLNVNSGAFRPTTSVHSGAINLAAGAALELNSGTHALNAGTTLSGAGTTVIGGGTVTANAAIDFATPLTLTVGTLNGPGRIAFSAPTSWVGTTLSGASASAADVVDITGPLSIGGSSNKIVSNRTLNLGDGLTPAQASWTQGLLYLNSGAVFNNRPLSTFETSFDGAITFTVGTGTFNNQGTFTKSGGTGSTTIGTSVSFNNSGTLNVNSGKFSPGSSVHSGVVNLAAGTALELTSGTHALNAGTTFSGPGTTVIGGGTVMANAVVDFATPLTLSGGTLSGPGRIAFSGPTSWTGTTLSGTSAAADIVDISGALSIGGTSNKTVSNRTLNLGNGLTPAHANWTQGPVYLNSGAVFNNRPLSTFETSFDGAITITVGTGTFNNQGTFTKSGGTGSTTIGTSVSFNNSGTLNVNSGKFSPGSSVHSGVVNLAAGTALELTSGTHALNAGTTFSGAGTTVIGGGTVTANAAIDFATPLTLSGGTLSGPGKIVFSAPTSWIGTALSGTSAAADIVDISGALSIGGTSNKTVSNRTLNLGNGLTPAHASWTQGLLYLNSGSVFNNRPLSTFETSFDGSITITVGAGTFNNQGTFTKSGGTGSTTIGTSVSFNNSGTLNVNSGKFSPGSSVHSGAINLAAGTALELTSGTHALNAGTTFSGAGTTVIGSLVTANAAVDFATPLTLSGGTLSGPGKIVFSAPTSWNGTALSGTSAAADIVDILGALAIGGTSTKTASNRTLNLGDGLTPAQASWTQGMILLNNSSVFNNRPLSTFETSFDGSITVTVGAGTFNNQGTFTKSGGTGTTTIGSSVSFSNAGVAKVSKGTLSLGKVAQHSTTAPITLTGGSWIAENATLLFSSGSNITRNQADVTLDGPASVFARFTAALATNEGSLALKGGRLLTTAGSLSNSGLVSVEGPESALTVNGAYTQASGATVLAAGAQLTATAFQLNGGRLEGNGSIFGALISSGSPTIAPGLSAGTLSINGNAGLTGLLELEIGGMEPGNGYDQLLVSGGLAAGGDLSLALIDEFLPTYGVNLVMARAGSAITGSFANAPSGSRFFAKDGRHSFAVHYGLGSPFNVWELQLADFSDDIPPVLSHPEAVTAEATGPLGALVVFEASALDAVQGAVTPIVTPASGSLFPLGETLVTITASDVGGNLSEASFTVTVVDTTPPIIAPLSDLVVEATGPGGAEVEFSASAADLVTAEPELEYSAASGSLFPLGATVVTVSASDAAGNVATASFAVTVVDTTPPGIAVPASVVEVTTFSLSGAEVIFAVSAADLVDPVPAVVAVPASGALFPLGDTVVNVAASDAAGNQSAAAFTVRVTGLPKLSVEHPEDQPLLDGASVNFGSVIIGADRDVAFVVRNLGAATLELTGSPRIEMQGDDAAQFAAASLPAGAVAPGASTEFIIRFTPTSEGGKSAGLLVATNDADAAAYQILLNGAGVLPLPLGFSVPPLIVPPSGAARARFSGAAHGRPRTVVKLEASIDLGVKDPWTVIAELILNDLGQGSFEAVEDERPAAVGASSGFFRLRTE
jgi:hypothetical protein